MFVRVKRSGQYEYLQVVQNERLDRRVRQRVIATLGRLDVLQGTGQLDALLASCAQFAMHSAVLSAHRQGRVSAAGKVRIGPPLVFERLWEVLGLPKALGRLLAERKFGFDVEWAVFPLSHSLFCVTARPAIGAPSLRLRRPANNGRWDTELLYTRSARKANAKTSHSLGFVRKVGSRVESHPPDVRSAVARHRFLSPRDIALPKTRGDCRCGARRTPNCKAR